MAPESPAPQPADKQIVAVPPPAKVPLPVATPPSQSATTDKAGVKEKAAMADPGAVKPEIEEAAAAPASTPEQAGGERAEAKPEDLEQAKQETASQPQTAKQAPAPAAGSAGTYVLDAGAFLFAEQSDDLKNKISELGYKPAVTEVKASVRLIRLRVGSYPKEQLASALEEIRKIAPGAFSLVRDGQSVVYAGSFADQHNIRKLSDRLREKGIDVVEEPVKVDRNLSRIQFGEFPDEASAETAAEKVEAAGIPVRVVKK
jgi:cell division septation protein DedD